MFYRKVLCLLPVILGLCFSLELFCVKKQLSFASADQLKSFCHLADDERLVPKCDPERYKGRENPKPIIIDETTNPVLSELFFQKKLKSKKVIETKGLAAYIQSKTRRFVQEKSGYTLPQKYKALDAIGELVEKLRVSMDPERGGVLVPEAAPWLNTDWMDGAYRDFDYQLLGQTDDLYNSLADRMSKRLRVDHYDLCVFRDLLDHFKDRFPKSVAIDCYERVLNRGLKVLGPELIDRANMGFRSLIGRLGGGQNFEWNYPEEEAELANLLSSLESVDPDYERVDGGRKIFDVVKRLAP